MKNVKPFNPKEKLANKWLKEASQGTRRLHFSQHAELRMRELKIGRRQILETLGHGTISKHLHQDIRGDWRCNVSWTHSAQRITV